MEINRTLASFSELFILLAFLTYAVAFCAFMWDLIRSGRVQQTVEKKARSRSQQLQPALAGAPGRTEHSYGQGSANGVTADLAERPGSKNTAATMWLADDSMRYSKNQRRVAARVAVALMVLAALIHGAAVVMRGIAGSRVPWGNMYEFCTTGGFLVAAVFLLVLTRRDLRFLGAFVVALILVMLFAASSAFYVPVSPLIPSLRNYWLVIHVSIAVLASAIFTLTFAMAVLQLIQTRREASLAAGKPDKLPFMRLSPSALSLENFAYRLNAVGFVGWTLTLIFGAMWAQTAWGRYWGWDTKEVWTFVIWVIYAGYLHSRATRGWTGVRAAWLSIIGYLGVIFNFTIVNIYFAGFHSYSGLN